MERRVITFMICEDSSDKYEGICQGINWLGNKLNFIPKIKRTACAKACIIDLSENKYKYDFLICDMQMPFNKDERISIDAGIKVLERVRYFCDTQMFTTICSSDRASFNLMEKASLDNNFDFIHFGSSFLIDLENYLIEKIKILDSIENIELVKDVL